MLDESKRNGFDGFTFWFSMYKQTEMLGDPLKGYRLFQMACTYAFFDVVLEESDPVLNIIFEGMRPNIDSCKRAITNGRKGGRPRKNQEPSDSEKGGLKGGFNPPKNQEEYEKEKEEEYEKEKETRAYSGDRAQPSGLAAGRADSLTNEPAWHVECPKCKHFIKVKPFEKDADHKSKVVHCDKCGNSFESSKDFNWRIL